ncbi:hypothetical protein CBS101457_000874 [Exobasidium rhododendri]|nr:hypothetical protein CBS101457_000874 [Exobasidium rhododendri]
MNLLRTNAARTTWLGQPSQVRSFGSTSHIRAALPTVLLLDDIELANEELAQLRKQAEVVRSQADSRQSFVQEVNSLPNVVALYRHFGGARSIKITGKFDQDLISLLPPTMQFLCHNGAGYDQLDVDALTKKGIQASNVPTAVDDSTSTTALWLMIGALRKYALAQSQLSSSLFNSKFPYKTAHDPGSSGAKVLGIVGAGGIGKALARKASSAFNMDILYHNRNRLDQSIEKGMCPSAKPAEYVSTLDELLARSDVVSLHCPLNAQTKGLISKTQLQTMKRTAVLVNTSRGPVVNEEDLADALEEGVIAGAGLDVFEKEPSIHPKLLNQSQDGSGKALLLPHIGTLSLETQKEMEAVCLRNIMHGLQTGKLSFTVAEQRNKF